MKKVLILVNHDVVIYNFRKELVEELLNKGYKVIISSPYGKRIDYLVNMGCEYVETNINRHGTNIIDDFQLILKYMEILKKHKPDIVLTYTIKPNIYGGIACKLLKIPYIATITGLGTALEKDGIMKKILITLYKYAFSRIHKVFFQNISNLDFFKRHRIISGSYKIVPGSGVNLNEFSYTDYPKDNGKINILFVGRIMKEKGIEELVEAAKIIKKKNGNVFFEAVGFYENDYVTRARELQKQNIITFHGEKENVKEFIKKSNVVILPSYHEGMANVLLEASAMGRPIIASNIPGCKEIFEEGKTGFGVEPKSVKSIIKAINSFLDLPHDKRKKMGELARLKVEQEFDRRNVVMSYINEIETVLKKEQK